MLNFYKGERNDNEPFKDFVERVGAEAFEPVVAAVKDIPELNRDTIDLYMDYDKTVKYQLERGEGECAI